MELIDCFGNKYDPQMEDRTNKRYKLTKLQQSYVNENWFVSTAYRVSSAMVESPPWYFETMVWEKVGDDFQGKLIYSEDSGRTQKIALRNHAEICRRLVAEEPLEIEST